MAGSRSRPGHQTLAIANIAAGWIVRHAVAEGGGGSGHTPTSSRTCRARPEDPPALKSGGRIQRSSSVQPMATRHGREHVRQHLVGDEPIRSVFVTARGVNGSALSHTLDHRSHRQRLDQGFPLVDLFGRSEVHRFAGYRERYALMLVGRVPPRPPRRSAPPRSPAPGWSARAVRRSGRRPARPARPAAAGLLLLGPDDVHEPDTHLFAVVIAHRNGGEPALRSSTWPDVGAGADYRVEVDGRGLDRVRDATDRPPRGHFACEDQHVNAAAWWDDQQSGRLRRLDLERWFMYPSPWWRRTGTAARRRGGDDKAAAGEQQRGHEPGDDLRGAGPRAREWGRERVASKRGAAPEQDTAGGPELLGAASGRAGIAAPTARSPRWESVRVD